VWYDNSNAVKFVNEWTPQKEHMLIICLSLYGTVRVDEIAKNWIFRGYEARHLRNRTFNLIRYHSVKPFQKRCYDFYSVRNFFIDSERAESYGFQLNRLNQYCHPSMTEAEKELFFLQFALSDDRRALFQRLRFKLNIPAWTPMIDHRLTTIEKIVILDNLEKQLLAVIRRNEMLR
jgi:hypothetical protein